MAKKGFVAFDAFHNVFHAYMMSGLKKKAKQAQKGFRPPSAMKAIGYFQNLKIFLESFWIFLGIFREFFWRTFLEVFYGGIVWEDFLGGFFWRIFLEDFLGGFFGGFFGRNYLVEINKALMLLSRLWGNFVSMKRKEEKF